jgi:predicted RNA-binding protein with PIN domain
MALRSIPNRLFAIITFISVKVIIVFDARDLSGYVS